MELNTQYWGEGVYSDFKDLYYAGTGSRKTIGTMLSQSIMKINEKLDPSAFYSYSYGSKIASMIYSTANSSTLPDVYRVNSPFANYGFIQCDASVNILEARLYIDRRIAYGQTSPPVGWGDMTIVTRYALSKIRACCYVRYYKVDDITSDFPSIVTSGRMELKDFLASADYNEYQRGGDIIVYQLEWKLYVRGDTGVHEVRENLIPAIFCEYSATPPTDSGWEYSTDGNKIYGYAPACYSINGGFVQGGNGEDHSSGERASDTFANTSDLWDIKRVYIGTGTWWRQTTSLPPENLMKAFHEFAYFGLYYTNNTLTATNYALSDDDLFLGVISSINGGTSGKYIQFSSNDSEEESEGKARTANTPAVEDTDPMEDPNPTYTGQDNPDDPTIDPNNYVDTVDLSHPTLSTVDVFNRSYAITAASLRVLADDLWNADDDKFSEIVDGLKLMGENPMNGLIDCRLYPFDITQMVQTAGSQPIVIGRTTLTVSGVKLTNDINAVIDLGSCKFMAYNNNFLDYSPYTTGRLVLPYCGTIPIDCAEFVGHTITAKMIVDIITGACCCCVFLDNVLTITAQGVCGVSIPMTGTDSASYASGVVSGLANAVTGVINAGVGIATGNVLQAGAGVAEVLGGAAKATQTPVQYAQSGTATPSCNNWLPQMAYFVVDCPIPNVPDDYGHCIGYACEIYDTLSNFSGFTVITNPDLQGFNATETEKDMIRSLMQEGIYL